MISHFLRKYDSAFFALTGALIYIGSREYGLGPWGSGAVALLATILVATLFRQKPSGTRLD